MLGAATGLPRRLACGAEHVEDDGGKKEKGEEREKATQYFGAFYTPLQARIVHAADFIQPFSFFQGAWRKGMFECRAEKGTGSPTTKLSFDFGNRGWIRHWARRGRAAHGADGFPVWQWPLAVDAGVGHE